MPGLKVAARAALSLSLRLAAALLAQSAATAFLEGGWPGLAPYLAAAALLGYACGRLEPEGRLWRLVGVAANLAALAAAALPFVALLLQRRPPRAPWPPAS